MVYDPTAPPAPSEGFYVSILVGLPGAGKLNYASDITSSNFPRIYLDNIRDNSLFVQAMEDGFSIVIADPTLCLTSSRNITHRLIKDNGYLCTWTYFENDLEKCWANVVHRKEEKKFPYKLMKWLSSQYKVPNDAQIVKPILDLSKKNAFT